MNNPITHAEHEAVEKRIDVELQRLADEDRRQNKRLDAIESDVRGFNAIATEVKELAVNMGHMLEELREQGKRLGRLESREGETWQEVKRYIIAAIVGGLITFLFPMLKGGLML